MDIDDRILKELFSALGAHLESANAPIMIVVVGGASLAATGLVHRTTKDVDVIARAKVEKGQLQLERATPFPDEFLNAVSKVARDFGLPSDWLNAVIDKQWNAGLPPDLEIDIEWRLFSALTVGFVGRRGLIPLKFFAAVDQGPGSKHWQDLLALRPTEEEIHGAETWVRGQDASIEFKNFVRQASETLRRELAKY